MRHITAAGEGRKWFEMENRGEATHAGEEGHTAFGAFFLEERRNGISGRYFVLRDAEGSGLAFCRIPPKQNESNEHWFTGFWSSLVYAKPVVVARYNRNPFPLLQDAIQTLAQALNTTIDESCYPYRNGPKARKSAERDLSTELDGPNGPTAGR